MPQLVNSIERERQKHIFHHIKTRQPVWLRAPNFLLL